MLRWLVTGGFLVVAIAVLTASFWLGVETPTGTLLVNLGTEIVGIVLTVAIVEWFFERRRVRDRGRQLAWQLLDAVEHAVWVWQGGPRQMDTDDVRGVLDAVGDDDPIADFTEGLMLSIGTSSRRLLNNEPLSLMSMPGLMSGVEHLAVLSSIRDGKSTTNPRKAADLLDQGIMGIAKALGRPTERHLSRLIRYRDPSLESQERRHFGDVRGRERADAARR